MRPIEYDKERVLDEAMNTFWAKGFEGTSMRDLVNATQLNTRTMYNLFGDKEGLFHAALDRYQATMGDKMLALLEDRPGLEGVHHLFQKLGARPAPNGCLMVNTLTEKNCVDAQSIKRVQTHFSRIKDRLTQNLKQARRAGEFSGDPETTAGVLLCFMQGLSVASKMGLSVTERKAIIRKALALVDGA